jgi:hypothetical protein
MNKSHVAKQSINQAVNQPSSQSIRQAIKQSINQAVNQSGKQSSSQSTKQSINQAVNQPSSQSINQSINQASSQWHQSIKQSMASHTNANGDLNNHSNNTTAGEGGQQIIQLCEELNVLLCLLCPAAIKPGVDQVKRHYRDCHRTVGAQLQEVVAFAASFAPSGSQPRTLRDPTDASDEALLPADGSPPVAGLETYAGFSCKSCRHLTRDRSNRDRH